jgi:transposase, IS5 family
MEYLIRDRLSWLRFLGFDLGAPTPDANTIRLFREKLTEAGALDTLFADFDRQLKERGYLAMGGQIVDATVVPAPKQIPWAGWRSEFLQNEVVITTRS